jgi:hypothetical protein
MADLVTDFRGGGQAGHRDTPKGVCPVLSHLLSGQMSRRVPSLSHVPKCSLGTSDACSTICGGAMCQAYSPMISKTRRIGISRA